MANQYPLASEVVSLRDAMDRLLSESFVGSPFRALWAASNGSTHMALPIDAYATSDEVVIIAAAPGIAPEDIEITWNQGTVTLRGHLPNVANSEEGKAATWFVHELPSGTFQRSLTLPVDVDADKAHASFEHGMLKLTLPKAEAAKPKQIKIEQRDQVLSVASGADETSSNS